MHPPSKAAFEFAAFDERCIMKGQAQNFIKQKWFEPNKCPNAQFGQ